MSAQETRFTRVTRRALLGGIEVVASVVLIVMMLQVVINALSRTIWKEPIFGTLEATQFFFMPILALLGLVAAQARDEHIVADLLFDSFPPLARRITSTIVMLTSAVVTAMIAWFAFEEFQDTLAKNAHAGNTEFVVWPVHLFMVLMYVVFTVQLLLGAVAAARGVAELPSHDGEIEEIIAEMENTDSLEGPRVQRRPVPAEEPRA